jgi:hypothetical protein
MLADAPRSAKATVTNTLPVGAQMMVLDLAAPPGFDVMAEDFEALVTGEKIKKYSLAARQILVYLDHLDAGATSEVRYRLKARVALEAQSGESRVYAYYEPSQRGRAKPTAMVVTE